MYLVVVLLFILITTSAVLHLRADHLKHQTPDHDPHHIRASPPNG